MNDLTSELLACLIEFVDCNDGEHTLEMYNRARNVIARAEGRKPLFEVGKDGLIYNYNGIPEPVDYDND